MATTAPTLFGCLQFPAHTFETISVALSHLNVKVIANLGLLKNLYCFSLRFKASAGSSMASMATTVPTLYGCLQFPAHTFETNRVALSQLDVKGINNLGLMKPAFILLFLRLQGRCKVEYG